VERCSPQETRFEVTTLIIVNQSHGKFVGRIKVYWEKNRPSFRRLHSTSKMKARKKKLGRERRRTEKILSRKGREKRHKTVTEGRVRVGKKPSTGRGREIRSKTGAPNRNSRPHLDARERIDEGRNPVSLYQKGGTKRKTLFFQ